jgi:TolB-like protein
MKKTIITTVMMLCLALVQGKQKRLAVVSFDVNAKTLEATNLTELLRIELAKHDSFELVDRYEIEEVLKGSKIQAATCFSRTCLTEAGKLLKADHVLSGSMDKLGESMYLRLRLIDVNAERIIREVVKEYLFLPTKINTMVSLSINDLLNIKNDQVIERSLTSKDSYESSLNNPYYERLRLSGPRMGYVFLTGEEGKLMSKPKAEGGYEGHAAMFQLGYQFEKQYLNEGKWQALFEFIPMITGVDQGLLIPSMTIMNGLRSNKSGFELALGPSFSLKREKEYFNVDGTWQPERPLDMTNGIETEYRLHSGGSPRISSSVVIAAGYSIRSGKLNIPINAFWSPTNVGHRFGISVGFNGR